MEVLHALLIQPLRVQIWQLNIEPPKIYTTKLFVFLLGLWWLRLWAPTCRWSPWCSTTTFATSPSTSTWSFTCSNLWQPRTLMRRSTIGWTTCQPEKPQTGWWGISLKLRMKLLWSCPGFLVGYKGGSTWGPWHD